MRIRAFRKFYWVMASFLWIFMSTNAFAATKTVATVHSPSIWDQAVNAFADLINYVAHHLVNNNYGIALIAVTILIRLVTVPLMIRSLKNAKKMQLLQPHMAELKQKYSNDPRKYQEQVMGLYKEEGVNPFGGCMPMIVQGAILTLFYRAIYTDANLATAPFLWLSLGKPDPLFILPIIAAVTSYFQQRLTMVQADSTTKMLQYLFPVMIFIFSWKTFSALPLYWSVSNIFTIIQLYFTHVKPRQSEVVSK